MSIAGDAPPRLARRPALVTAAVTAAVFLALAAVLIPWDWVPGGDLARVRPGELFTAAEIARAEEYAATRRLLGWTSTLLSLSLALLLGLTRLGGRLLRRVQRRLRWWAAVPLGVAVLLLLGRVLTLPVALAVHARNRRYGLSVQGWGSWVGDYALSLAIAWVVTAVLALLVVGAARWSPRHWFAWAGAVAAAFTVVGSFVYPVVVEPLFNRFTSMPEGEFRTSVLALAERQGVEIDDVLVSDASRRTTTLNAYVSGLGATRRVVVYDNLLSEVPPDQARVVVAHELAHARHADVLVGTALGALGAAVGMSLLALLLDTRWLRRRAGVGGPQDPAAVALLLALLSVGSLVASPVQNTMSRAVEARADRESLRATGEPEAFVRMQRNLAVHSLSDPTPPRLAHWWFGSHPTVLQRVALAPASSRRAVQPPAQPDEAPE